VSWSRTRPGHRAGHSRVARPTAAGFLYAIHCGVLKSPVPDHRATKNRPDPDEGGRLREALAYPRHRPVTCPVRMHRGLVGAARNTGCCRVCVASHVRTVDSFTWLAYTTTVRRPNSCRQPTFGSPPRVLDSVPVQMSLCCSGTMGQWSS